MSYNEVLNLYFERSNQMQTFWSFYPPIVLGYLAFFGSLKKRANTNLLTAMMLFAFVVFAGVNLNALCGVTTERLYLRWHLEHDHFTGIRPLFQKEMLKAAINPPSFWGVVGLHLFGDLFTIAAVLFLVNRKEAVAS